MWKSSLFYSVVFFLMIGSTGHCVSAEPSEPSIQDKINQARDLPIDAPEKERLYREVLKRAPDNTQAMFNLAVVLQAKQQYAEASQLYAAVLKQKPDDAVAHYQRANVLLAQQNAQHWQAAAWHLRQFISQTKQGEQLAQAKNSLAQLESRLGASYAGVYRAGYDRQHIQSVLSRVEMGSDVRGPSKYDGPRLPLMFHFAPRSAVLTLRAKQQLDHIAMVLKIPALAADRIQIEGYTDSREHANFEQRLHYAKQRAQQVRDYLVKIHGLDATRFVIKPLADLEVISTNNTREGRAANRRVELYNLDKGRKLVAPLHE